MLGLKSICCKTQAVFTCPFHEKIIFIPLSEEKIKTGIFDRIKKPSGVILISYLKKANFAQKKFSRRKKEK